MAVVQSTYGDRQPKYVLGMIVNQELHNSVSRILADATPVGYGRAMFASGGADRVTATPSATGFEGVIIRDVIAESATPDTLEQNDTLGLCDKGVIVVQASVAVNRKEPAYVTSAGAWTNVSSGNTLIPNATFDETIGAAGLVALRIK